MKRLDDELWNPNEIGLLKPSGFLTQAGIPEARMVYRPLYDYHLVPPPLPESLRFVVATGLDQIRKIDLVAKAYPGVAKPHYEVDPDRWLAVVHDSDEGQCVAVLSGQTQDLDIAFVRMFWISDSRTVGQVTRDSLWHVASHELAKLGFVGITTTYADEPLRQRYVGALGWAKPLEDAVREAGSESHVARLVGS